MARTQQRQIKRGDCPGDAASRRLARAAALLAALLTLVAAGAASARPVADTKPPSVPQGQRISSVTATTITMGWRPATDNVRVAGYEVWLDGRRIGATKATSWVYRRLRCGRTYRVGLEAFDAAGNRSSRAFASGPATTASCRATAPVPAKGAVVEIGGTVSPRELARLVSAKKAKLVTVRPAPGRGSFTVSGPLTIHRPGVQIVGARVHGTVEFAPGADGSSFSTGFATGLNIFGADDVTVRGSTFDGGGTVAQSFVHDLPAGSTPDRFRIVRNVFRNFRGATPDVHSEALFVGYATDGLIEGNTFENNGTTSHIFFTWFGTASDPSSSFPRNICVRGNTFGPTAGAYFAVDLRQEIPASTGIAVEPGPSNRITVNIGLSSNRAVVRRC